MRAEPSIWRVRALGDKGHEFGVAEFTVGSESDASRLVERFRAFVLSTGGDLRESARAAIEDQRRTVDAILQRMKDVQGVQSPSRSSDLSRRLNQTVVLIKLLEQLVYSSKA